MSVKFQLHQWQDQSTVHRPQKHQEQLPPFSARLDDGRQLRRRGGSQRVGGEPHGLPPTFHKLRIPGILSEEYMVFAIDRTKGSARTNAINSQLDLLYEYCQFELARSLPGPALTHPVPRHQRRRRVRSCWKQVGKREQIVRLNNLLSFTSDEERAWEFGDTVWEIRAPLAKIFFFNDLLPNSILKGGRGISW